MAYHEKPLTGNYDVVAEAEAILASHTLVTA